MPTTFNEQFVITKLSVFLEISSTLSLFKIFTDAPESIKNLSVKSPILTLTSGKPIL